MLKIDAIRGNNIYLIGDEKLDPKEECLSLVKGDCRLFVRKTSIEGLYQYDSEQLCEDCMGHKKGYIWARRASVMNKVFDLALYCFIIGFLGINIKHIFRKTTTRIKTYAVCQTCGHKWKI